MAALPAWLQQRFATPLPADAQAQLVAVLKKQDFTDVALETYEAQINAKLTTDRALDFVAFLDRNVKKGAPVPKAGGKRKADELPSQKKVRLPGNLGLPGLLGRPVQAAKPDGDVATEKRPRETLSLNHAVQLPERSTGLTQSQTQPMPSVAPVAVTLKNAVNEKLMKTQGPHPRPIVSLTGNTTWAGTKHAAYTWMDEPIEDRAAAQNARLERFETQMVNAICERHLGEEVLHGSVGVPVQAEVAICGRIACEALDGKLNEHSMVIEGSRGSAHGARMQIASAQCPRLAAFPGQIVSVVGRSGMTGTTFHARDFLPGLPIEPALKGKSSLHMLVAAGPFCMRDALDYTPLEQILQHAAGVKPQVLVLMGPFVDAGNLKVSTGDISVRGVPCSFEELYSQHVLPKLDAGVKELRRVASNTEVLILPSLDEVLSFHPMPQPPIHQALSLDERLRALLEPLSRTPGVRFLPNPAHLEINGLRVSLTSADALSPVLRELVLRPAATKIEEALRLLLYQRTLFPVLPREPPQVSETRAEALDLPDGPAPDICVFPSMAGMPTGTFVDDTVFLNPGLLCRGGLGSFAELQVEPAAADGVPMRERVRVEVLKLGS